MSSSSPSTQRLDKALELIREKGLSRKDLELLEEILKLDASDLAPMFRADSDTPVRPEEYPLAARLRRSFGLLLAFLSTFSDRRLGEIRSAMGQVILHSLAHLEAMAEAARREASSHRQEPEWVVGLLDLIASLRAMSSSLVSEDGAWLTEHWAGFLQQNREHFRGILSAMGQESERSSEWRGRLNQQIKALNSALQNNSGRPLEQIRRLEAMLTSALPEATRTHAEPLLLVQCVIASLRMNLARPLDRGVHWPGIENVRGSLHWLWNHLGWSLPRVGKAFFEERLPLGVRDLLKQLRRSNPSAFRIVARALASHLTLVSLVEGMEPAVNASVSERYAAVPVFFVVESELGRLAERVYHPRIAEALPEGNDEERLLLSAFLRQAVLALVQDQATIRGLLQQALVNQDGDQLASSLDNLRALLLSHQRQLMADLVGLFSPELRLRLFPDSPSLTEEGDRLRQRLHRLWEYLDPALQDIRLHLELMDLPRLALSLGQVQNQLASFRRSPEFLLIRNQDRQELDRLTQQMMRLLDRPEDLSAALREGADLAEELLRFLDVFLLRINARVPLIRLDLTTAREARQVGLEVGELALGSQERTRAAHKLIQVAKHLGVRDAQTTHLLKRWVRAERGGREPGPSLEALASHLGRLSSRLEAAMG
ncbi:MAG: hypothetical protein LWX11_01765 [Firmicutes bacterium]|nr:hypothetical protein [Bacillota bacterium]